MQRNKTERRLNFYCQVIIVMLAAIALRLWMMPSDVLPKVQAQVADSGAQRFQIIEQAKRTNELLGEIHQTLKGTLKVQLEDQKHEQEQKEAKTLR